MKPKNKRLIIDLDGTICTQMESGQYARAEPNQSVIDQVNRLWIKGWDVVIFTARGMNTFQNGEEADLQLRQMTEDWLKKNRVCYTELLFGKPAGDLYVDDKGMSIGQVVSSDL